MRVFPQEIPEHWTARRQHHLVSLYSLVVITGQSDIVELWLPPQLAGRSGEEGLVVGPAEAEVFLHSLHGARVREGLGEGKAGEVSGGGGHLGLMGASRD